MHIDGLPQKLLAEETAMLLMQIQESLTTHLFHVFFNLTAHTSGGSSLAG